ncbi:MAG TPA: DUF1549 domain-containing protein, partial [Pirellulales bacterium]|nr:DUF1549 domain-containing protein [Pirellulales bacterium]
GAVIEPGVQEVVRRLNACFAPGAAVSGGVAPANTTSAAATVEPAAPLAIGRRLSLALAGTIPSLEEIRQFERQPSEEAVAWWLDQLLADRRTSDYLAERLARAFVGTQEGPFLVFRRRRFVSWLADELHANRPYDEIVRQLIASDGLWTSRPATNFITVTIQPDNDRGPDANQLAARTARAFLGIRLDCAECHDHPFTDWKQRDFRALAGFFGQAENSLRGIRDHARPAKVANPLTGELESASAAVPFAAELLPAEGPPRERLARWVTDPANKTFAQATANRMWAQLFGRPLIEPIDDIPLFRTTSDTSGGQADDPATVALTILADDFVTHGYDLRRLIRTIALSAPFAAASRTVEDTAHAPDEPWGAFPLTRLRPEQVVGSLLQASSLATLDYQSHILLRFARAVGQSEFVTRYGDSGEDEFAPQGGTVPQRLLLMNGELLKKKTEDNLVGNAATQIAALASTDEKAIETAYLACLTRRPTVLETAHFAARLADTRGGERRERMEDLYWALLNSTEFAWNH